MNNLPNRVKQIRKHFGLTQEKFADQINKSTGLISSVESDRSGLSDDTIQDIASVFGINKEWLKNGTGSMFLPGRETEKTDSSGIGDRVRKIRTRGGLSQNQLAERTNYNKKQIYNIEKGRCKPSDAFVNKLCAEFNVSFDWLMYGEGDMEAGPDEVDLQLINWLRAHPGEVRILRAKAGLKRK